MCLAAVSGAAGVRDFLSRLGAQQIPADTLAEQGVRGSAVRLLTAHRDELTVTPRSAARTLRALALAMSHPLLVERPAPAREIVRTFLHGVSARGASPC